MFLARLKGCVFLLFAIYIVLMIDACATPLSAPTAQTVSPSPDTSPSPTPTPVFASQYSYQIVRAYPHDPQAFTEGLVFADGFLYESTGNNGSSSLRKVELETGQVLQIYNLPAEYFGEGMTIFNDQIIQLTWKSKVGFVYARESFDLLKSFNYNTEGWGLTHDASRLIMSDGTANLYFLNPETYAVTGSTTVQDKGAPVTRLNELEYIKGKIFANVWQTDKIAIIEPEDGTVISWIDLSGILQVEKGTKVDVLNGIAYDEKSDRLFVTGKYWPRLFEIDLVPKGS